MSDQMILLSKGLTADVTFQPAGTVQRFSRGRLFRMQRIRSSTGVMHTNVSELLRSAEPRIDRRTLANTEG